jgi:geranylgeranyl reductase family protein
MHSGCSVTIVGAGPSGAAAAACLASAGVAVTLIDQHEFPRDKTCGDGLIPDALSALRELGMLDEVLKHARRVPTLRLYAPDRASVAVPGDLACVPRKKLDQLLLDNAMSKGAEFHGGCRFLGVIKEKGRVTGIRLRTRADDEREVKSTYTVLATGASSEPLRAAGVCLRKEPSGIALRAYFAVPDALAAEMPCFVISLEQAICPGYGWIFAGPDNVFNMGVGLFYDSKRKLPTNNLRESWRLFLEGFEPARRLKAASKQLTCEQGAPLRTALTGARLMVPGLFVVGEAAGTTYSFTGEGIGKALQSGMLAAQSIIEASGSAEVPRATYETALTSRFSAHYRGYKIAQDWLSSPAICNFITRRAEKGCYAKQKLREILAETTDPTALFSVSGMLKAAFT